MYAMGGSSTASQPSPTCLYRPPCCLLWSSHMTTTPCVVALITLAAALDGRNGWEEVSDQFFGTDDVLFLFWAWTWRDNKHHMPSYTHACLTACLPPPPALATRTGLDKRKTSSTRLNIFFLQTPDRFGFSHGGNLTRLRCSFGLGFTPYRHTTWPHLLCIRTHPVACANSLPRGWPPS